MLEKKFMGWLCKKRGVLQVLDSGGPVEDRRRLGSINKDEDANDATD